MLHSHLHYKRPKKIKTNLTGALIFPLFCILMKPSHHQISILKFSFATQEWLNRFSDNAKHVFLTVIPSTFIFAILSCLGLC